MSDASEQDSSDEEEILLFLLLLRQRRKCKRANKALDISPPNTKSMCKCCLGTELREPRKIQTIPPVRQSLIWENINIGIALLIRKQDIKLWYSLTPNERLSVTLRIFSYRLVLFSIEMYCNKIESLQTFRNSSLTTLTTLFRCQIYIASQGLTN